MVKMKRDGVMNFLKTPQGMIILLVTGILLGSVFMSGSSLGGFQSVQAQWTEAKWTTTDVSYPPYVQALSGTTFAFDGDYRLYPDGGFTNDVWSYCYYSGDITQPKYTGVELDYKDWWINDTVSETNPEGEAKHFEWSLSQYEVFIELVTLGTYGTKICNGAEFWFEIQNNVDSVFSQLGAEGAASYVIEMHITNYTVNNPTLHATVSPHTIGTSMELFFVDANTMTPAAIQEGSDLDFESLERYSHVKTKFVVDDFGTALYGTDPNIYITLILDVLTVGRFDYVLDFNSGGDNDITPIGTAGIFDSIAIALSSGFNALMDRVDETLSISTEPLLMLALIVGGLAVIVVIMRFGRRGK